SNPLVGEPTKEASDMYQFAIVALLGLAVLKVADLVEDYVPGLARIHALLTFALAIAATVALDYSLFRGFHVPVRDAWMGSWFTGFIVGSMATAWRAVLGWLGFSEAPRLPQRQDRPRVAA